MMMTTANMGLRESINSRKGVKAVAVTIFVLAVVAIVAWQLTANSSGASGTRGELYFTTDDGATTFTAPANLVPPFDHNGKQAVRAVVFSNDGGKTTFVGYLERYTAAAKQQMEAAKEGAKGGKMVMSAPSRNVTMIEVKKPGDKNWVDQSSAAGANLMRVTAPGGGAAEMVTP